ncbi:Putative protein kinase-like domain superfamily [Colletotrichum destructivum]|uniref:Protein kinase domain-containing protein n=1 Tax=Colletotrichum destructivum TaxID=34406 RepID=A0AAX4HYL3_9PEZI|nr:Putative protein kinase-like domain superfamily [Colletotrichum destructivum]
MGKTCPNLEDCGHWHINGEQFLRFILIQLAQDHGRDADAVRLSSSGYTLAAKGVERLDLGRLRHENDAYDRLQPIQGTHVTVCLGSVDLVLPYYYDSDVFKHFLFLGWAGLPLFDCINQNTKIDIVNEVAAAYRKIHRLHILHHDAEQRNIMHDQMVATL